VPLLGCLPAHSSLPRRCGVEENRLSADGFGLKSAPGAFLTAQLGCKCDRIPVHRPVLQKEGRTLIPNQIAGPIFVRILQEVDSLSLVPTR
jgi:hypothetical protein